MAVYDHVDLERRKRSSSPVASIEDLPYKGILDIHGCLKVNRHGSIDLVRSRYGVLGVKNMLDKEPTSSQKVDMDVMSDPERRRLNIFPGCRGLLK